jgi:phosphoribosylaminoimidazole-succinocarboxamide synthase
MAGAKRMSVAESEVDAALLGVPEARDPDIEGRSKQLWLLDDGTCLVRMLPTVRSFTYQRDEIIEETEIMRLDFYERAAAKLSDFGLPHAFVRRLDAVTYLAEYCPGPPFEVIVKNYAVGSTIRKYPGLFTEGERFSRPVVKFDYRTDPEDQPIGEDYLRLLGVPVDEFARLAREVNLVLAHWLAPIQLWDLCLIFGTRAAGTPVVTSEISLDCMRLRSADGASFDKDLFRAGRSAGEITGAWRELLDGLA